MKYKNYYSGQIVNDDFDEEYKNAVVLEGIRIGSSQLFRRTITGIKNIPFDQVERGFMRKRESNCRTCTSFVVTDSMLVLRGYDGKEFIYMNEDDKLIKRALAELEARGMNIGVW